MAGQLQQQGRRGGQHARPGPPARSRAGGPDGAPSPPLHRGRGTGKRTGARVRPSRRRGTPAKVGLLLTAVALVLGTAVWVQDLREPSPSRSAGTSVDDAGTGSAAPAPGTGSSSEPDAGASPDAGAAPDLDSGRLRAPVVQAAVGPQRDAAAVQTALEQVLGARAAASTALLRAVVGGDLDAAVPAAAAVDSTSADLETVVGTWRDPQIAEELRAAFDAQIVASRAYATAVRADDDEAADAARAEMGASSRTLGQLLEQMTAGTITRFVPPEDASRLRDLVDAQAVGDTASADDIDAWLTARMSREGTALAKALAGPA